MSRGSRECSTGSGATVVKANPNERKPGPRPQSQLWLDKSRGVSHVYTHIIPFFKKGSKRGQGKETEEKEINKGSERRRDTHLKTPLRAMSSEAQRYRRGWWRRWGGKERLNQWPEPSKQKINQQWSCHFNVKRHEIVKRCLYGCKQHESM